jgi:hypothetical protein
MSLLKVLGLQRPATMSGAAASKVSALGHGAAAAAASGSKAGGVPGVVRVATGDFFRPALRVLSPVGAMALPQNGEATIDRRATNAWRRCVCRSTSPSKKPAGRKSATTNWGLTDRSRRGRASILFR